jgi:hypothetical protein
MNRQRLAAEKNRDTKMPRQELQFLKSTSPGLSEQDSAIPDQLEEGWPDFSVHINIGSKSNESVFVVINSEGLPGGIACAVRHNNARFTFQSSSRDLVRVVVLGVLVTRREVVGCRVHIFCTAGSGYAV